MLRTDLARNLICLFLGAATAVGIAGAAGPTDELTRGRDLYREHCLECHGKKGLGDGEKSKRLGFRPRDFSLGAFKCRSTPTGKPPTEEDLARVIVDGLPGSAMRGFGDQLAEGDVAALISHLGTLSPALAGPPPAPLDLPPPPENLSELESEGRYVYQVLKCWTCHGASGRGDGPAAKALVDDWGDRIRVFNFVALRRFKCGGEPTDLYRTLHSGMTGSPMPSYTEAFSFARENATETAALESSYDSAAVAELSAWASGQPDRGAIRTLTDEEKGSLVERRTWALVAYLRSLAGR